MQVSWIDEDNLRDLAGGLTNPEPEATEEGAVPKTKGLAWELHTLPDSAFEATPPEEWQSLAPESAESDPGTASDASSESPAAPEPEAQPAPMPSAAIDQIRESLKSVRERASEAGLLKPVASPAIAAEAPPAQPAPTPPPILAPAPSVAPSTEPIPAEISAPIAASEFSVPIGPVPVRLDAFAVWAKAQLGEAELFLLDEEGQLLWGVQAKSGLVLSAALAWSAARHSSAIGATLPDVLHKSLPEGGEICVVPCDTHHGMIQIGVQRSEVLSEAQAQMLRDALCAAMSVGEAS